MEICRTRGFVLFALIMIGDHGHSWLLSPSLQPSSGHTAELSMWAQRSDGAGSVSLALSSFGMTWRRLTLGSERAGQECPTPPREVRDGHGVMIILRSLMLICCRFSPQVYCSCREPLAELMPMAGVLNRCLLRPSR